MTSCILPGHITELAFEPVTLATTLEKLMQRKMMGFFGGVSHLASSGESVLKRQLVRRA